MKIYRIDTNSRTGIISLDVADNYQLQKGDFTNIPTGYTPIKLDSNGQLVGSTLEEHETFEKQWLQNHPESVLPTPKSEPSQADMATAMMMKQLMTIQNNQEQQQKQQQQINAMMLKQLMMIQTKINK